MFGYVKHKRIIAFPLLVVFVFLCVCMEFMHTEKIVFPKFANHSKILSTDIFFTCTPDSTPVKTKKTCLACQWEKNTTSQLALIFSIMLFISVSFFVFQQAIYHQRPITSHFSPRAPPKAL